MGVGLKSGGVRAWGRGARANRRRDPLGLPQPDRFSRAFRTAVGMSPSEYRVAIRTAPASAGDDVAKRRSLLPAG